MSLSCEGTTLHRCAVCRVSCVSALAAHCQSTRATGGSRTLRGLCRSLLDPLCLVLCDGRRSRSRLGETIRRVGAWGEEGKKTLPARQAQRVGAKDPEAWRSWSLQAKQTNKIRKKINIKIRINGGGGNLACGRERWASSAAYCSTPPLRHHLPAHCRPLLHRAGPPIRHHPRPRFPASDEGCPQHTYVEREPNLQTILGRRWRRQPHSHSHVGARVGGRAPQSPSHR